MGVGIDTRNTGRPGGTGIATYATLLAEACRLVGLPPQWLHDDAAQHAGNHALGSRLSRLVRSLRSECPLRSAIDGYTGRDLYRAAEVRDRLRLSARPLYVTHARPPVIMHWTCPLPIMWPEIPNVVTMHDLIPLLQPELCGSSASRMLRRLKRCGDAAAAIVTVSNAVRNDIIEHLAYPASKVVNLSQPVSFSPSLLAEARREVGICPPGSFLYFGLLERRKNIGRMIRAHGLSGSHRSLVLIGKQGFGAAEEMAALAEHPAPERVQILPWCSRASLVRAIQEARCVFFPSLAEGFGLPIAEAMTLGTPVITSLGHATEEIAGGSAYLVDPFNVAALAHALSKVGSDDALASRLVEAGYARSRAFTLKAYAERLGSFYSDITGH